MTVERLLLYIARAGIFSVPLAALVVGTELIFPDIIYPTVTWKSFAFRLLVQVATGAWLLLAVANRRYRPRFSWVLTALVALAGVLLLADFAGVNPYRSLWGGLARMSGWVRTAHLLAFFLVAGSVLDSARQWKIFFHVSLGTCAVVSYLAVEQLLGLRELLYPAQWAVNEFRLDARFGSPVFLGGYTVFHVFLAAFYGLRTRGGWTRAGYGALLLLFLVVLAGTGTRAAQVGTVIGGAVTAVLLAVAGQGASRRRAIIAASALGCVLVAGIVVLLFGRTWLVGVPILERFAEFHVSEGTRALTWDIAMAGIADHPFLGWGQQSFTYVFDRHFNPFLFDRQLWADDPHNVLLAALVSAGIVGLVSYVAVWVAALTLLWSQKIATLSTVDRSVTTGMLVGHGAFLQLQPDSLMSQVLFVAALGYVHSAAVAQANCAPVPEPTGAVKRLAVATPLVLIAMWFVIDRVSVRSWSAAITLTEGLSRPVASGDEQGKGTLVIGKLFSTESFVRTEAWCELVDMLPRWQNAPPAAKDLATQIALREMDRQIAGDPDNVMLRWYAAKLLNNTNHPRRALAHIEHALEISPRRQILLYEAATAYQKLGRPRRALERCRQAFELKSWSREARERYLLAALRAGDRDVEEQIVDKMRRVYRTKEPRLHIYRALVEHERGDSIITLYEPLVTAARRGLAGGDSKLGDLMNRALRLARGYQLAGRTQDAIALYRELMQINPEFEARGRDLIEKLQ